MPTPRSLYLLVFFAVMAWVGPAHAQLFGKISYATSFDAAFAYFLTAKEPLDLEKLIRSSDIYNNTPVPDRLAKLEEMKKSLTEKLEKYNPSVMPLTVRVPAQAFAIASPPSIHLDFRAKRLPYFPFDVMDRTITLFPDQLEKYIDLPVDGRDYMARVTYALGGGGYASEVVLDLIPVTASGKEILLDGVYQRVLICDIARIRLISGGQILWADTNPKYDPIFGVSLRGLFAGARSAYNIDDPIHFTPQSSNMTQ